MKKLKGVLVVEDSQMDVWLAEKIIEIANISTHVLTSINGADGLKKLEVYYHENGQLPELILVDLQMPCMNGFEFVENLKALPYYQNEKTKVVMLTACLDDLNEVKKLGKLGVKNVFIKPLNKNDLLNFLKGND